MSIWDPVILVMNIKMFKGEREEEKIEEKEKEREKENREKEWENPYL